MHAREQFLIAGSIILVLVLVLVITIIIWCERRGKPLFTLSRQLTAHHRQVGKPPPHHRRFAWLPLLPDG